MVYFNNSFDVLQLLRQNDSLWVTHASHGKTYILHMHLAKCFTQSTTMETVYWRNTTLEFELAQVIIAVLHLFVTLCNALLHWVGLYDVGYHLAHDDLLANGLSLAVQNMG